MPVSSRYAKEEPHMHDNDFKTSCHHMSTCALTGASAFFDAIPGSFMLINGPLWCYFYAMKYVEDYDASPAGRQRAGLRNGKRPAGRAGFCKNKLYAGAGLPSQ